MDIILTSNNTVRIDVKSCLDCKGNNSLGFGGFRDKIEVLGLDFEEFKNALYSDLSNGIPYDYSVVKDVEVVDFQALKEKYNPYYLSITELNEEDYYDSLTEVKVVFSEVKIKSKKIKKDSILK